MPLQKKHYHKTRNPIFNNRIISNTLKTLHNTIQNPNLLHDAEVLNRLIFKLEKRYSLVGGFTCNIMKQSNEEEAAILLHDVRKALLEIRETYDKLEALNFFSNTALKNICDKMLDAFYNIEFVLRKKAFKSKKAFYASPEAEITARLQLQTL